MFYYKYYSFEKYKKIFAVLKTFHYICDINKNDMNFERDILIGNYFLDSGNKILRVDGFEDGFNDDGEPERKIYMNNIIDVEPSLLHPEGKGHFHPYTEYFSKLKPINYTQFHSIHEKIFKYESENGEIHVGDYVVSILYYDGVHLIINDRHEKDDDLKTIFCQQGFFHIHEIQNIVYSITKHVLELNDKLLLMRYENGNFIK